MAESMASQVEKKTYTKPKLVVVRLVAQEAVLALCKNNGGVGARDVCLPDRNCVQTQRS